MDGASMNIHPYIGVSIATLPVNYTRASLSRRDRDPREFRGSCIMYPIDSVSYGYLPSLSKCIYIMMIYATTAEDASGRCQMSSESVTTKGNFSGTEPLDC